MNPFVTPWLSHGRLKAGALLLAGLGLSAPAWAQSRPAAPPAAAVPQAAPAGPWTLQQAVDYAVQNNLQVRQSQLQAELSEATYRQSRMSQLPTANAAASQSWNYGTNVDPLTFTFQNQTTRANNFSASGQLNLFSGFQVRNSIKRNALDYEASLLDIEQARNDLSLTVASAYLQLLLGEELVRTNELRINSAKQQIERTQKLLRAGSVPESNLADARAQLATDELNLVTAQNQRDLARLQLVQALNLEAARASDFAIAVPNLPDPDDEPSLDGDVASTFEAAQTTQPQVKAADLRVRSAQRSQEVSRGAYYPRLTFGASIFSGYSSARNARVLGRDSVLRPTGFIYQLNPATGQPQLVPGLFAGIRQPNFETLPEGFGSQVRNNLGKQLSFNLNIPILNGWQARTNVQRSVIGVKQAELRAAQTRLQLRQTIQQAYADALAAQRRYAANKRQVEALGTAYRNAEIRFNNGLMNGTDFNIAKNNLTAAESGMIQAKYEFIFRRKVLDFYQGKPLTL
ncbi:TolC family protein [Hymenobacter latericus]|uniref:TolC family protein n=1 Tax=Hymenobacter sp. YIM 151858-1 TaxID=2987688 RepID=UPI002225C2CC|nr:TolC family protein [Hymenobacter sp. YIM 151858-1]UYZ60175.1 TolC family protein [Hymenobacter sp. YIM 151858-1]